MSRPKTEKKRFALFWAPEGKRLGVVEALNASLAKAKAPFPYRKYRGEIRVEEVIEAPLTKVIFRVFSKGGDVIALFPAEPGSVGKPHECMCYMHVGQHGAADLGCMPKTRLATPGEYAPLAEELRSLGYRLEIRLRTGAADLAERKKALGL